jgi:hypothetical protein
MGVEIDSELFDKVNSKHQIINPPDDRQKKFSVFGESGGIWCFQILGAD